MSQVNFGAGGGAAHKPGVYPGIHEVGADNYIAALLNESMHASDAYEHSGGGAHGKTGGNRLVQLGVAALVGFVAWKAGLNKLVAKQLGNLKNLPAWLSNTVNKILKRAPKSNAGEQLSFDFMK